MSTTVFESLEPGLTGGKAEHYLQDPDIGENNENHIQEQESNVAKSKHDIDSDAGTCQTGNAHVLTISVRDDVMPTVGQSQEEKHQWNNHVQAPQHSYTCDDPNDFAGEGDSILKGLANGNVAVKAHDQQCNAFDGCEEVDEEHLRKATYKRYFPEIEPEDAQHFRDGGCGQTQVN